MILPDSETGSTLYHSMRHLAGSCCHPSLALVVILLLLLLLLLHLQLKMLQGVLPTPQLLQRYGLREYESFRQALQAGDVGLFDRSMQQHQLRLIVNGTLLLLEKLRFNVYRR